MKSLRSILKTYRYRIASGAIAVAALLLGVSTYLK